MEVDRDVPIGDGGLCSSSGDEEMIFGGRSYVEILQVLQLGSESGELGAGNENGSEEESEEFGSSRDSDDIPEDVWASSMQAVSPLFDGSDRPEEEYCDLAHVTMVIMWGSSWKV